MREEWEDEEVGCAFHPSGKAVRASSRRRLRSVDGEDLGWEGVRRWRKREVEVRIVGNIPARDLDGCC